jgi:S1-C subfamily serine protease
MKYSALLVIFCTYCVCAQDKAPSFEERVEAAEASVVGITLKLEWQDVMRLDAIDRTLADNDPRKGFVKMLRDGSGIITIGSGFIINGRGDVATADHVINSFQGIDATLSAFQIVPQRRIVVPGRNFEERGLRLSGYLRGFPYKVIAEDKAHDVAVLSPDGNIFQSTEAYSYTKHSPVFLNAKRPMDGEDVFACGFPIAARTLITTSGHIGSAWSMEVLVNAKQNGLTTLSDVYTLDLRINPGNSGGALFATSDQSVLGIIVETQSLNGSEGVAKAASISYLIGLLDKNHIPWQKPRDIPPISAGKPK